MEVDVERNVSTIQDRPMLGFREQIKESTADGSELVEVVLLICSRKAPAFLQGLLQFELRLERETGTEPAIITVRS